jgi:hypothetical protein
MISRDGSGGKLLGGPPLGWPTEALPSKTACLYGQASGQGRKMIQVVVPCA